MMKRAKRVRKVKMVKKMQTKKLNNKRCYVSSTRPKKPKRKRNRMPTRSNVNKRKSACSKKRWNVSSVKRINVNKSRPLKSQPNKRLNSKRSSNAKLKTS